MLTDISKVVYPRNEFVWVQYFNNADELEYIITSKQLRDCYYLYEFVDGSFNRLGKAQSPVDLEMKYKVVERICKK